MTIQVTPRPTRDGKKIYYQVKIIALTDSKAQLLKSLVARMGVRACLPKDADPTELRNAFDAIRLQGYYGNHLFSRSIVHSSNKIDGDNFSEGANQLSYRELTFLQHACSEKTYTQIAREMFVANRTVDGYRESLFKKLGVASRVGLVMYAIRSGVVKI